MKCLNYIFEGSAKLKHYWHIHDFADETQVTG